MIEILAAVAALSSTVSAVIGIVLLARERTEAAPGTEPANITVDTDTEGMA